MTLDASRLPLARSFFDLVSILVLKLVASFSSDLFDSSSAKDKAARFMAELIQKVSNFLNASLASLSSNLALLETCATEVFLLIRTTTPADLNLLAVLESSLSDLITAFASSHRKEAMRAARVFGYPVTKMLAHTLAWAGDAADFRLSRNGDGTVPAAAHSLRECGGAMARRRGQFADLGVFGH
jgi:hypothetical protein